jgi:hypothetical protein
MLTWFCRVLSVEFGFAARYNERRKKVYYATLPYLRCMSPPERGYS